MPERVLELRHLAVDHLHPGRRDHVVSPRLLQRRRGGHRAGLAARVPVLAGRGRDDGPGGLGVSHGRRAVSLGVDPRRPRLGLGHRLVQPRRAGHRAGRHQRRHVSVRRRAPSPRRPASNAAGCNSAAVALITFSQALVNHLGIRVTRVLTDFSGYWILLVADRAHGRAAGRRRRRRTSRGWSRSPTSAACRQATARSGRRRNRSPGCSRWASCCRRTRSPASTPRPTPPRRRSAPPRTCRAASSARCWSPASSAG